MAKKRLKRCWSPTIKIMDKRKSEYKPLLFTTTMRNPERLKDFLLVLSEYEGEVLTNEIIENSFTEIGSAYEFLDYFKISAALRRDMSKDELSVRGR